MATDTCGSPGNGEKGMAKLRHICSLQNQVSILFREPFILHGYRNPRSTALQCLRSIFQSNNETLNFWTHFVPALFFVWQSYQFGSSNASAVTGFALPMVTFLFSVCVLLTTSAFAHMLNTMSVRVCHVCFFYDYGALSVYSFGSAVAYKAYIFPVGLQGTRFADAYLYVAAFGAVAAHVLACETRFLARGILQKVTRFSAYCVPYLFVSFPVLYHIATCRQEEYVEPATQCEVNQFITVAVSGFFYASHIPERFFPGRFDIVAHSHQLFHMCGAVGMYYQMAGLFMFMKKLDGKMDANTFPATIETVTFTAFVCLMGALVPVVFALRLSKHGPIETDSAPDPQMVVRQTTLCNHGDKHVTNGNLQAESVHLAGSFQSSPTNVLGSGVKYRYIPRWR